MNKIGYVIFDKEFNTYFDSYGDEVPINFANIFDNFESAKNELEGWDVKDNCEIHEIVKDIKILKVFKRQVEYVEES